MEKNPFKYGEQVTSATFCNRTREIARIAQAFNDGQNVSLIGPRRFGKSSLIREVLSRHKTPLLDIQLDCFGITSSEQFLEVYLKAVLKKETGLTAMAAATKKFLKGLTPYISFAAGESGEIAISLQLPKTKVDPTEILDLPAKLAKAKDIPFVVCIDEFQKISEWKDGDKFLEKLRSVWQQHQNVSYCLYGSKRHMMSTLFNDSTQPFYRFGDTIFLEKISGEEWSNFWLRFLKSQVGK